ncbi:hypothetical protein ACFLQL_00180 [Verrucomicrobiota bacterium]
MNKTSEAYKQGFEDLCKQAGVDPQELVKKAQSNYYSEGSIGPTMENAEPIQQAINEGRQENTLKKLVNAPLSDVYSYLTNRVANVKPNSMTTSYTKTNFPSFSDLVNKMLKANKQTSTPELRSFLSGLPTNTVKNIGSNWPTNIPSEVEGQDYYKSIFGKAEEKPDTINMPGEVWNPLQGLMHRLRKTIPDNPSGKYNLKWFDEVMNK